MEDNLKENKNFSLKFLQGQSEPRQRNYIAETRMSREFVFVLVCLTLNEGHLLSVCLFVCLYKRPENESFV